MIEWKEVLSKNIDILTLSDGNIIRSCNRPFAGHTKIIDMMCVDLRCVKNNKVKIMEINYKDDEMVFKHINATDEQISIMNAATLFSSEICKVCGNAINDKLCCQSV